MRKSLLSVAALLTFVLLLSLPQQASAQTTSVAPYFGYNFGVKEWLIGGDVRIRLPVMIGNNPLIADPGFEFYPGFGEEGDDAFFLQLNLDVAYGFRLRSVEPYVRSGFFINRQQTNVGTFVSAENDFGFNLKGGILIGPPTRPQIFAEAGGQFSGNSAFVLRGGVFFNFGVE